MMQNHPVYLYIWHGFCRFRDGIRVLSSIIIMTY